MRYDDLRCEDVIELVTEFLEGSMAPDDRADLERHLAWCDWCATYFEQMRQTIKATGSLREQDVPEPIMDVLVDAFREIRGD